MHKGVVEFNSVVRIRNRIGVLEDALRVGDQAAGAVEVSVVESEDSGIDAQTTAGSRFLARADLSRVSRPRRPHRDVLKRAHGIA